MCGAEEGAFAAAKPVLEKMGRKIIHCGEGGAGQAAKICNNMLLGVTMIATVEAFVLAEKLGLSHQALFDVASTGGATLRSLRRLGRGRRRFLRHHQDDPRQERRLTEFNAARKGCKKSHMGKHVASRDLQRGWQIRDGFPMQRAKFPDQGDSVWHHRGLIAERKTNGIEPRAQRLRFAWRLMKLRPLIRNQSDFCSIMFRTARAWCASAAGREGGPAHVAIGRPRGNLLDLGEPRLLAGSANRGGEGHYEGKLVQVSKGELKTPEFLAINPLGRAPALRDGDFTLHESLAIMAYLDRKHQVRRFSGAPPRKPAGYFSASRNSSPISGLPTNG